MNINSTTDCCPSRDGNIQAEANADASGQGPSDEQDSSDNQLNLQVLASNGLEIDNPFHNEKLQDLISLGGALCFLGKQYDVESVPKTFWSRYQSVVDNASALDLVHSVSFLPEESVTTALSGIGILSDYRYACKTSLGAVPALYVEFMIQYQSFYASKSYVDCSIGLYAYIMKQESGYSIADLAKSLGTGNDRAYRSLDLLKKGLVLNAERINVPGAGRADIDTVFAHDITPEVIAAAITNEDLQIRKTLKELEELTNHTGSSTAETGNEKKHGDGFKLPSDGGALSEPQISDEEAPCPEGKKSDGLGPQEPAKKTEEASSQSKGVNYKPCETEEIDPHQLKTDTLRVLEEACDIIASALEGKKMDFELLNLLKRLEKDKKKVEDYYALIYPNEGDVSKGEMISFDLLPAFVDFCDALRRRCDELIQVRSQNEDHFAQGKDGDPEKTAYWRRKLLHKVVDRKWFLCGLDDEESRYARICELINEVARYVAAAEAAGQEEGAGSAQEPDAKAERAKRYEETRAKALSDLEAVIKQIEAALKNTADHTKFYQKGEETLQFLRTLREDLIRVAQPEFSKDSDVRTVQEVMVTMIKQYMGDALELWAAYKKRRDALKHVVDFLSTEKFTCWVARAFRTYDKVFQDFQKSQEAQMTSGDEAGRQEPDAGCQKADEEATEEISIALEEALTLALESIEAAISSFQTLIGLLNIASSKQVVRKNSTANPIPDAVAYLEGRLKCLEEFKTEAEKTLSISVRKALSEMALSFVERNNVWSEMLSTDSRYSIAKQIANRVNRQTYHDFCEKQTEMALAGGENKGWDPDVLGHYKEMHADDPLGLHSPEECTISPSQRREIILALWKRGMDPTSVKAWLQYITEVNSKEIFADPMGNVCCCKLTPEELSNSFRYLTGCKFSGRTLWDYLKERMGFTRHQCVKEEQIGEPHPQTDDQYRYIDTLKAIGISNGKVLMLSLDSKAVVKIGRFKRDNGLLLCSPDGKVYRVHDHDYVLTWENVYGTGNCPVGKSRLKERAVVHPCAVYDVLANTCHVSFVLGTENSESMANILIKAIKDKLEERPDIESVLILSDGGGVNSSNGFIWKDELLRVADETNLKLQIAHYPPGCSRHNPVERGVFAPLSRAWKGKSLYNLEVLAELTCAVTTKKSKTGSPLKMTVFIDLAHYKTLKQKIADNDEVVTREAFEEKAKNRIIHPNTEEDGALFKWNYIVLPSRMVAKEAS